MGKPGKVALTVLAVLATALVLPTVAGATTPFGKNGRITFVLGAGDVGMMKADGSGQENLTDPVPGNRSLPVFSPTGSTILFWDGGTTDIWGMKTNGSAQTNLTETATPVTEFASAFFPDGRRVVYSRSDGSETDLWTMKPDGSDQRPLLETANDDEYAADVSPDGRLILFTRQINGMNDDSDVWVVRADGTGEQNLTETASPVAEYWASFSPRGASIVYDRFAAGSRDVWAMKPDGSAQHSVYSTPNDEKNPIFSPDGSRILFVGCPVFPCDLYTVGLTGGPPDNLTETPAEGEGAPDWEPVHRCAGRRATILGDDGPDVIRGTKKADVIVAFGGRDRLIGRGGNDRLCGGKGRDRIRAGKGRDRCKGGPARDVGRGCERGSI